MKKIKLPMEYRYSPDGCNVVTVGPGECEIHDEFYDRALVAAKAVKPKKRAVKKGPERNK